MSPKKKVNGKANSNAQMPLFPEEERRYIENLLGQIQKFYFEIKAIQAEADQEINETKKKAAARIRPKETAISSRVKRIHKIAESYKAAVFIGRKKSLQLTTGKIGWRTEATSIEIKAKREEVVQALKSLKLDDCIVTEEKPSKTEMKKYADRIKNIKGVDIKGGEEIFYVKPSKVKLITLDPEKLKIK
jgi:phage host-nuclease inhibitor protein Gam